MGSLERRLERLEASVSPCHADTGAREQFKAKLAAISESHRVSRERGEEPDLEGQSMASLLGLVQSYPHGEVPLEVADATRQRVEELSHSPQSVLVKVVRLCLESRGAA